MRWIGVAGDPLVLQQRLAAAGALARGHVPAGVRDEPVEPGRELRVPAELPQPETELGEGLLGGVSCILGIREQVRGQALDARSVPLAQRGERPRIAVFRSLDEDWVTEPLVDQRPLRPRILRNLTARARGRLHGRRSVFAGAGLTVGGLGGATAARPLRATVRARGIGALDTAARRAGSARGRTRRRRRADGRPWATRPALDGSRRNEPALLAAAAPERRAGAAAGADSRRGARLRRCDRGAH